MKKNDLTTYNWIIKSTVAGILLGLSRLPLHLNFLVFFAFIPIFSLFEQRISIKKLFLSGVIFGFIYNLVCLHWVSLVTIPGYLGMFILLGIYFGILFLIAGTVWEKIKNLRIIGFLSFWLAFEFIQNFGEFRFPWFNAGYALADFPILIQLAEIGGIFLLSFGIIIINYFIYGLKNNFRKYMILILLTLFLWFGYGYFRFKNLVMEKTDFKTAMIQVSIPQDIKWDSKYLESTVKLYDDYTRRAMLMQPDLIIWPESALPVYLKRDYKYKRFVLDLARELDINIFTGFPSYEIAFPPHPNRYKFYNSASVFRKDSTIDPEYHKIILVPFGERMPFLKCFPILWNIQMGQANFEYGKDQEIYFEQEYSYSPLICFEIAFPEITYRIAKKQVDFIVNITNDAWFHRSAGTYQHAAMTKIRAVETRTQIYRCANTGYSMIVNPMGEVLAISELFEKTVIASELYLCRNSSLYVDKLFWYPIIFVILSFIFLIYALLTGLKLK